MPFAVEKRALVIIQDHTRKKPGITQRSGQIFRFFKLLFFALLLPFFDLVHDVAAIHDLF